MLSLGNTEIVDDETNTVDGSNISLDTDRMSLPEIKIPKGLTFRLYHKRIPPDELPAWFLPSKDFICVESNQVEIVDGFRHKHVRDAVFKDLLLVSDGEFMMCDMSDYESLEEAIPEEQWGTSSK